ncbi:MAG: permease prefix domain 1-containing protein [Verrucomicrobia bacterium]|nr:permease prefix domain 1-containing protein [Verrucomicrobiota bacterium]MDA1087831.1 permease prefix domain 1-containing protein [Verrucomicrobiota bacterium]
MDSATSITHCLDAATTGLADDPELRTDIRGELASHLESAVTSYTGAGMTLDEGVQRAIEDFGSPAELSEALLRANRGRMRLRALTRMTLRWAAVPMALAVAVIVAVLMGQRLQRTATAFRGLGQMYPMQTEGRRWVALKRSSNEPSGLLSSLSPQTAFFFVGDSSRATIPDQQRAIWEAHPDDRVYYANSISALCAHGDLADLSRFRGALAPAARVDADNARYDYILAYVLLEHAVGTFRTGSDIEPLSHAERNALLEESMLALARGHAKPRYRRYTLQMLTRRLAMLPPASRVEDLAERLRYVAQQSQPDTTMLKRLAATTAAVAETLAGEGRLDEAMSLAETWRHLVARLNGDAFAYVDVLAMREIADGVRKRDASGYAFLRAPWIHLAAEISGAAGRTDQRGLTAVSPSPHLVAQHGSVLARMLTPASGSPPYPPVVTMPERGEAVTAAQSGRVVPESVRAASGRKLDSTRWAEHVLLEQAAVVWYVVLIVLMMLGSLSVAMRYRRSAAATRRVTILPGWSRWLEFVGMGLAVPVLVYALYSRGSDFSGREYGVSYLGGRFALELILLSVSMAALYSLLVGRFLRGRCRELGIAVPRFATWWVVAVIFCLAFLWGLCFSWRGDRPLMPPQHLAVAVAIPAAIIMLVVTAAWLAALFGGRRVADYHAVSARSRIPAYAVAVLFIALVVQPLLRHEEARYLQNERLFEWSATEGFVNTEYRRVLEISDEIREIFGRMGV